MRNLQDGGGSPAATFAFRSSDRRARAVTLLVAGGFFTPQDQLIQNASKLKGIPGAIIQGRYDIVTPLRTAWDLAKAWPDAELQIITDAGHAPMEPGIIDAMVRASDRWREMGADPK